MPGNRIGFVFAMAENHQLADSEQIAFINLRYFFEIFQGFAQETGAEVDEEIGSHGSVSSEKAKKLEEMGYKKYLESK